MKRLDITQVVVNNLCHSCGACIAICHADAISFSQNNIGQYLPSINYEQCSCCMLCYKVCPGINLNKKSVEYLSVLNDPFLGEVVNAWIGRTNRTDIFSNAQSGGLVSQTLLYLLEKKEIGGAVIVKGSVQGQFVAKPYIATTIDSIFESQKSKYLPVNLLSVAKEIEQSDFPIAIVGLPCHLHGLENLISRNSKPINTLKKNIKYKFGLICDGILTYAAIDYFARKAGAEKVSDVIFKDKHNNNYIEAHMNIKTNNGSVILKNSKRFQLKDIITPPRCKLCFDKMNIFADISFGDPWGVSGYDTQLGDSLIITRNEIGDSLIKDMIKEGVVTVQKIQYHEAVNGQKIDTKKIVASSFAEAYKSLGFKTPSVNEAIFEQNKVYINNSYMLKAKQYVNNFIKLNKKNRKHIVTSIDRRIFLKLLKTKIRSFANKFLMGCKND